MREEGGGSYTTELRRHAMIKFALGILEQLVCSAIYIVAFLAIILSTLRLLT